MQSSQNKKTSSKFLTLAVCHHFSIQDTETKSPKISEAIEILEDMVRKYPDFLILRTDLTYTPLTLADFYDVIIYEYRGDINIIFSGDDIIFPFLDNYSVIVLTEKMVDRFYRKAKLMTV